jgi:hypothetical protein
MTRLVSHGSGSDDAAQAARRLVAGFPIIQCFGLVDGDTITLHSLLA